MSDESKVAVIYGSDGGGGYEEKGTSEKPFRTDPTGDTSQPITASELPLPSGAATSGKQDTGNTSLGNIDTKTPALVSGRTPVDGSGVTQPISATALPLPAGAATETTLAAIKTKTDSIPTDPAKESGKLTTIDGHLDVNLSSRALESGGNLATLAGKDFATQTTLAAVLAKITSDPATQTTLAAILAKISSDPATQTTLAAVLAKLSDGLQQTKITDGTNIVLVKNSAPGASDFGLVVRLVNTTGVGTDVNVNGWYGSPAPTIGQKAMAASLPMVIASDQSAIPVRTAPGGSVPGISIGTVATAAVTNVPIRATTYTEQTSDGQRSIASASASDAAAGTGARQVKLTYYTSTGAGPYTETLTLNGTTGVNTVATNICFIEKMEVVSVGSGGSNAGIITLYSAINKGGVAVGTIAAGDNRTLWAHHYVPTGKSCYVTGISGHNNNPSNGTILTLRSLVIGVANAPEQVVSDFVRMGGGTPNTLRTYGTPITISGPARLTLYGAPEGTPSITQRGAFDYYDL